MLFIGMVTIATSPARAASFTVTGFAPVSFGEARRLLLEREARLTHSGVFLP